MVIMSVAASLHVPHEVPIRDTVNGTGFTGRNFLSVLLCIRVWITCVKRRQACVHIGEMLGSPLSARLCKEVLTCENTVHSLCIDKGPKLSTHHAAAVDK